MSDGNNLTPSEWSTYSAYVPIKACRLDKAALIALYKIIDAKQKDYLSKVLQNLSQREDESYEDFDKRKKLVKDAFVVSVSVTDTSEATVTGNEESFFSSAAFPNRIKSIVYTTDAVPQTALNHVPFDRIKVILDFSTPRIFDFSRLPNMQTANESIFQIAATNESWFAAAKNKLENYFEERKSSWNWLHLVSVYDLLLLLFGFPCSIWGSFRLGDMLIGIHQWPSVIVTSIYLYIFFFIITGVRVIFSYARWVFPKLEYSGGTANKSQVHRYFLGAISFSIICAFLYDFLKILFF